MALSDYLERLGTISQEGTRASDYAVLRGQRSRTKRDFLDALKLQQQRAIQFAVSIPPQDYQKQRASAIGLPVAGNFQGSGRQKFSQYPLKGDFRVSSDFGGRTHPITGKHSNHTGIDWAAPAGTPIYAPGSGVVRSADFNKIYGNRTILDFGGGLSSMFGHQSKILVQPGQQINAGQLIGYVGTTGLSTGPHLHFETWINNTPVNPLGWFM